MKHHKMKGAGAPAGYAKLLGAVLLAGSLGFASLYAAPQPGAVAGDAAIAQNEERIVVFVNDRFAPPDIRTERVREDLLRNAFYDAARRSKWVGDYEFEYNPIKEDPPAGSIEFNVLSWRRSPTGMYHFTASASYWNSDGEKVSLGKFDGMRTSIAVFNTWDVGEQFAGSAEDAFRDALRKLKDEVLKS